ncbi:hypothetical protein, partial [Ligilactobacillus salivarius]|uniref:hypothetical protein n=1 Tax=Ligilactobacillus salivarius TaxID=1624 RepID=UPI001F2A3C6F
NFLLYLKQKTIRLSSNSLKIIIKILALVLFDKEPLIMWEELFFSHFFELQRFLRNLFLKKNFCEL